MSPASGCFCEDAVWSTHHHCRQEKALPEMLALSIARNLDHFRVVSILVGGMVVVVWLQSLVKNGLSFSSSGNTVIWSLETLRKLIFGWGNRKSCHFRQIGRLFSKSLFHHLQSIIFFFFFPGVSGLMISVVSLEWWVTLGKRLKLSFPSFVKCSSM